MISRLSKASVLTFMLLFSHFAFAMGGRSFDASEYPKIDKVEVYKGERRMDLLTETNDGFEVVKSYSISLGRNPIGHKQQEGDARTPEGLYTLNWKNPNSAYHLSIHISYPNAQDRRQAQERGVSPGGEIFIHGKPNDTRRWAWLISPLFEGNVNDAIHAILAQFDWTQGCIAVLNHEMEEIWELVDVPTPIEIFP